jgi:hypothetical protein
MARLYLPVGTFPKGPLQDFDIIVDDQAAQLLPREANAEFQACYIRHLAERVNADLIRAGLKPRIPVVDESLFQTIVAICGFSSGRWQRVHQQTRKSSALLTYLERMGLSDDLNVPLNPFLIEKWLAAVSTARKVVTASTPEDMDSAAQNPLLILPLLKIKSEDQVRSVLVGLNNFLKAASEEADNGSQDAARIIREYSECGRHWVALAECVVPVDVPFMVKTSRKQELHLKKPKGGVAEYRNPPFHLSTTSRQLITLSDAVSNHVTVRVVDTNVELAPGFYFRDERYRESTFLPDAIRITPELLSFYVYSSEGDAQRNLWMDLPLRTARPIAWAHRTICLVTFSALAALLLLSIHWPSTIGDANISGVDVAVLVLPATIAAAYLLVGETSTLSTEVDKLRRYTVALALVALWILAVILYIFNQIEVGVG